MTRVAVVIDAENVWGCARKAFPDMGLNPRRRVWPDWRALGWRIAQGNGRGDEGELVEVAIFRGVHDVEQKLRAYRAALRVAHRWEVQGEGVVRVHLRPLVQTNGEWKEAGVDVAAGLGAWTLVADNSCDTVVVFSHDRDLRAVIRAIYMDGRRRVEVARWSPLEGIKYPGDRQLPHLFEHVLDRDDVTWA